MNATQQADIGQRLALGAEDRGVLLERAQGDGRGGRRYVPGSWEQAVAILTAANFRLTTCEVPARIVGSIGGGDASGFVTTTGSTAVHIHAPRPTERSLARVDCPTCKRRTFAAGWYTPGTLEPWKPRSMTKGGT